MAVKLTPEEQQELLDSYIETTTFQRRYTPDCIALHELDRQFLFTYGTLMFGMPRNAFLMKAGDAKFLCNAYTPQTDVILYRTARKKSRFPVAIPADHYGLKAPLVGEVYSVNTGVIQYLDEIESNGVMYRRKRIPVADINKRGSLLAWCYLGIPDFWHEHIHKGQINRCRTVTAEDANLPRRYYYYTEDIHNEPESAVVIDYEKHNRASHLNILQ
jgi:gamma-glutamylcyclotransferase (GGCT)/AIG2-like uncharacterized protein YtfP